MVTVLMVLVLVNGLFTLFMMFIGLSGLSSRNEAYAYD